MELHPYNTLNIAWDLNPSYRLHVDHKIIGVAADKQNPLPTYSVVMCNQIIKLAVFVSAGCLAEIVMFKFH
jgi:hypothetical protein